MHRKTEIIIGKNIIVGPTCPESFASEKIVVITYVNAFMFKPNMRTARNR